MTQLIIQLGSALTARTPRYVLRPNATRRSTFRAPTTASAFTTVSSAMDTSNAPTVRMKATAPNALLQKDPGSP